MFKELMVLPNTFEEDVICNWIVLTGNMFSSRINAVFMRRTMSWEVVRMDNSISCKVLVTRFLVKFGKRWSWFVKNDN